MKLNVKSWISKTTLLGVLSLCTFCARSGPARELEDYVVSAGNRQFRFVCRPELGYVVKSKATDRDIKALKTSIEKSHPERVLRIGGKRHKGFLVVRQHKNMTTSRQMMTSPVKRDDVEYMAPLFTYQDYEVAVIPEIIVCLTVGNDAIEFEKECRQVGGHIVDRLQIMNVDYCLVTLSADNAEEVFRASYQISKSICVEWAKPNIISESHLCNDFSHSNDNYIGNQWHLNNTGQSGGMKDVDINATEAWSITRGDPNIVVAVFDAGVDMNHPDLIDNLVPGFDFVDDDGIPHPNDGDAHGTACAGLIAGAGYKVAGVAPTCKIMPIRIITSERSSFVGEWKMAQAIKWAAQNGADILSLSLDLNDMDLMRRAFIEVTLPGGIGRSGKGCVVLASSGNNMSDIVAIPARWPEIIAVGAIDHNGTNWDYSNSGSELELVAPSGDAGDCNGNLWTIDVSGPNGCNNTDPDIEDYTDRFGGTSGACPIAAGVAALVLSIDPNLTVGEVRGILARSARDPRDLGPEGWDPEYGYGLVNALAAVKLAASPPRLYVDDDAESDPGPGDPTDSDPDEDGSLDHPFDSIQEAVDVARHGDTIEILPGIYKGDGNRDIQLSRMQSFGFDSPVIQIHGQDPTDPCTVAATIIDCNEEDSINWAFLFNLSETSCQSLLSGLTIINGDSFDGTITCHPGNNPMISQCVLRENLLALGLDGSDSTLSNCTIVQNHWGVKVFRGGNPLIQRCQINNNGKTEEGSAIYCKESSLYLVDSILSNNSADQGGAVFCTDGCSMNLSRCILRLNSARFGGAFLCYDGSKANFVNCILDGNSAESFGGAIFCLVGAGCTLRRCTVTTNRAEAGQAIAVYGASSVTVVDSIVRETHSAITGNGVVTRSYSNISGNLLGNGNIDADPCFADPSYWDDNGTPYNADDDYWIEGDYHLKSQAGRWDPNSWVQDDVTSPCIDAGNPNSDWTAELWPNGRQVNMGAFGGTAQASMSLSGIGIVADLDHSDIVDLRDFAQFADKWKITDVLLPEDLDRNGIVDIMDMFVFVENWLVTYPPSNP